MVSIISIEESVRSEKSITSESSGELGDEDAGYGESGEKGPATFPLPLEEHWPRIEQPHLSFHFGDWFALTMKVTTNHW